MTLAYVALGSNLGDSRQQVLDAMKRLAELPQTRVLQRSPLYMTPPWGVLQQPPFVNAAVELDTGLSPHQLLDSLLQIETAAGRTRAERNGPRTLDLDILLFGDRLIDEPRLKVPHYQMHLRAFVLYPLAELAPAELQLPDGRSLAELLNACPFVGLERLSRA